MPAPVVIVQRQTLDWGTMSPARYRELSVPFCRLWGRPDDYMTRLAALWDETFAYGYFRVRETLKAQASQHALGLPGTRFIRFDGYRNIPGDGSAYVFVDDDDWLSPELGPVLANSALQAHDAGIWKACTLGAPRSEYPLFFWGANGRCMTNNYAVTGHWLQGLRRLPEVCQHGNAEKCLPGLDALPIDAWLSITNKSPCSSVSLEHGLGADRSPERLAGLVAAYNRRLESLGEADFGRAPWAWPLFRAVQSCFLEVEASRR